MNIDKRSGIYVIINLLNGHYYIGSSKNIATRWYNHKRNSKSSNKSNYLYAAMRKYGIENFEIYTLLVCDSEMLEFYEQKFLDIHVGKDGCYNLSKYADAPWRNRKMTIEERERLSNSMKGRPAWNKGVPRTDEEKSNISKATKQAMKTAKRVTTDETRRKISVAHKGKIVSKESREKMSKAKKGKNTGVNNRNYGKAMSQEQKNKLSIAKKGKPVKSKLHNEQTVIDIRKKYASGEWNAEKLAALYSCTTGSIFSIIYNKTWKWVPYQLSKEEVRILSKKYRKESSKDRVYSEETLQKMSERTSGSNNGMYGKKHKVESILRMAINRKTKLTEKIVLEARRLYETEKYSYSELGKMFGCDSETIRLAIQGKTWKWLK